MAPARPMECDDARAAGRVTRRRAAVLAAVLALFAGCAAVSPPPRADGDVGIVMLHGKWGGRPRDPVNAFVRALRGAGYEVIAPDMPWSARRAYDVGYAGALDEIDGAVRSLAARGVPRVVLGGYSLGANAALGYAATRGGLAGLMLIAPGHTPEALRFRRAVDDSVVRARVMVAAGHGAARASFEDTNQGVRATMTFRAADYLSYFDPEGAAVMPANAARIREPVPVLWVIGAQDPLAAEGPAYAFSRTPPHAKSRYVMVDGGHKDTGVTGADAALRWLGTLSVAARP